MSSPATYPIRTPTEPRNKGGRPRKPDFKALAKRDAEAFDSVKEKWAYLSLSLADQAIQASRGIGSAAKKPITQLLTSAAIAYDKAWHRVESAVQPAVPPSIVRAITKAVTGIQLAPPPADPPTGTDLAMANSVPAGVSNMQHPTNSVVEMTHPTNGGGGEAWGGQGTEESRLRSLSVSALQTENFQKIEKGEGFQQVPTPDADNTHLHPQEGAGVGEGAGGEPSE